MPRIIQGLCKPRESEKWMRKTFVFKELYWSPWCPTPPPIYHLPSCLDCWWLTSQMSFLSSLAHNWRKPPHPRPCLLPRGNLHPMTGLSGDYFSCPNLGQFWRAVPRWELLSKIGWAFCCNCIQSTSPCFLHSPILFYSENTKPLCSNFF